MYAPAQSCSVHSDTGLHHKFSDRQLSGNLISHDSAHIHLKTIQVSDCNLRVNLYAAGGWAGLSQTEQRSIVMYGEEFRRQLAPLASSEIGHGGFIMPCLVHCVTGYAFWLNGRIEGITPYAAFWRWFVYVGMHARTRARFFASRSTFRYAGNSSATAWTIDSCTDPSCNPTCVYLRW